MAARRPGTPTLTEAQARHLLGVMSHADDLLASAERAVAPSCSPFARLRHDVAPQDQARVTAFVETARERMAAACDRLGAPRPSPGISARWSIDTAFEFAAISFADLEPRTMRGYGPVPDSLAEELAAVSAALQELMRQGIALLYAASGAAEERA